VKTFVTRAVNQSAGLGIANAAPDCQRSWHNVSLDAATSPSPCVICALSLVDHMYVSNRSRANANTATYTHLAYSRPDCVPGAPHDSGAVPVECDEPIRASAAATSAACSRTPACQVAVGARMTKDVSLIILRSTCSLMTIRGVWRDVTWAVALVRSLAASASHPRREKSPPTARFAAPHTGNWQRASGTGSSGQDPRSTLCDPVHTDPRMCSRSRERRSMHCGRTCGAARSAA